MKGILLILGNGLSMDLRNFVSSKLDHWNPQNPLQWDIYMPGKTIVPMNESLPRFSQKIAELRQAHPSLSDFDIFKRSLDVIK